MKTISYILILIGLTFSTASYSQKEIYASSTKKFSITMPASYVEDKEDNDFGLLVKTTAKVEENTYMFSYIEHNVDMKDNNMELLQVSLEAFNEQLKGKITTQKKWKVGKYFGFLADIEMPNEGALVKYGVILANNIQYQVVVIGLTDGFDEKLAKKFIKSFSLGK